MTMSRALFTACNRAFFPGAEALLAGSARLHRDIPRFCMVPQEELAEARGRFGQLAEIIPPPRALAGIPAEMQVSIYKLFAVTLPFETVAYVDADAIFCAPAPELWETETGKWNAIRDGARSLGATVPEVMAAAFARQFPGVGEKKAFNGGVFALRTAEWRDLPEQYEHVLAAGEYRTYHPIFDQAMMNAMIQPRVKWLPFAFNVHNLFDRDIPRDARVIHYAAGACKPWDARYPRHEPQYHYWLKYGLNETRTWPLLKSRLLVAAITPKRLLGRMLRQRRERRGGPEVRSRWDVPARV
jgi:hypothetical protein